MSKYRLEIFQSAVGLESARVHCDPDHSLLLHSAVNPRNEINDLAVFEIWGDIILCLGTGLGYHLELFQRIKTPKIFLLCDYYPELLERAKSRFEGSEHQVYLFSRNDILYFPEFLTGKKIQEIRHPASYRLHSAFYQSLAQKLTKGNITSTSKEKPRVMLAYGQHFLEEELSLALAKEKIESIHYHYSKNDFSRIAQEFHPTHFLSVNLKGIDSEGEILHWAERLGIQVHTWFVDDPRPIALALSSTYFSQIHAWCWERHYLPWLAQKDFIKPRWLPLAGAPQLFHPMSSIPHFPSGWLFVGSPMGKTYLDRIRRSFLWSPSHQSLVESLAQQVFTNQLSPSDVYQHSSIPFVDERNRTWFTSLVLHTASHLRRVSTLKPLLNQHLTCIGDPNGWKEYLGSSVQTLPEVDYRSGLNQFYQAGSLHINSTSCQMPTSVNQRVFDIPLAGGFLLTDAQADLKELFASDEVPIYETPAHALELTKFYSSHDVERNQITEKAKRRVLNAHTYDRRIREILEN